MSDYYEHIVSEDEQGQRLDALLGSFGFMPSRSAAARLIEEGFVLVDGEAAAKRHNVKGGERIEIEVPPRAASNLIPEHIPLDIRFEDKDMIVLSKPPGLVVHPAQGHWSGTLVHALLAHS
ncbi:MAG TPA: S4 domain-containing protein, partial [Coriobacteriia bacterium]|nr:S4 domain-containing protein [Coriobacteriia bacterium]